MKRLGLWIGMGWLLTTISAGCCRGRGTNCLYDKPCGGVVGISWTPEGDWGYGLHIQTRGSYAATNKALAILDDSGQDGLVIYGDGHLYAYRPAEFTAPIKVKEIYTDSGAKWPDYVFDPSYKLRNIYDLEAFIRQNKHLPGLPSQELVAQQGLPMVTTQKALVEKVEELTLYVIALQKQVDSLKALFQTQTPQHSR